MIDDGRALAARLLARTPFAMPRDAAVDHMKERHRRLLEANPASSSASKPPQPDFAAAEPMPVLDQPAQFAADFWAKRRLPRPYDEPPKPAKPRGRRPAALTPAHDRFRVVDGDKQE